MSAADAHMYDDAIKSPLPQYAPVPSHIQGADIFNEAINQVLQNTNYDYDSWKKCVDMALTRLDGGLGRGSDSFAIAAYRELMRKFIHAFPADHQTIDQHANFEWQMAGDIPNAVDIGSQVYEQALSYAGLCLPLKESQINFIVSRTNDWAAQDSVYRTALALGEFGSVPASNELWVQWMKIAEASPHGDPEVLKDEIRARAAVAPILLANQFFDELKTRVEAGNQIPLFVRQSVDLDSLYRQAGAAVNEDGTVYRDPALQSAVEGSIFNTWWTAQYTSGRFDNTKVTWRNNFEQSLGETVNWTPKELSPQQVIAWQEYIKWSEQCDPYEWSKALYERALVVMPKRAHFWHRYGTWMMTQTHLPEQVRIANVENIFNRAAFDKTPTMELSVRLEFARCKEDAGNAGDAQVILDGLLELNPADDVAIPALINYARRMRQLDPTLDNIKQLVRDNESNDAVSKKDLVRIVVILTKALLKDGKAAPAVRVARARQVFDEFRASFADVPDFYRQLIRFEVSAYEDYCRDAAQFRRVRDAWNTGMHGADLDFKGKQSVSNEYLYALENFGGLGAAASDLQEIAAVRSQLRSMEPDA